MDLQCADCTGYRTIFNGHYLQMDGHQIKWSMNATVSQMMHALYNHHLLVVALISVMRQKSIYLSQIIKMVINQIWIKLIHTRIHFVIKNLIPYPLYISLYVSSRVGQRHCSDWIKQTCRLDWIKNLSYKYYKIIRILKEDIQIKIISSRIYD